MAGFYCTDCGVVQPLPCGPVNCRRCGRMGLAGFDSKRPPIKKPCPIEGCDGKVWVDGGTNSPKYQHNYGWGGGHTRSTTTPPSPEVDYRREGEHGRPLPNNWPSPEVGE